MLMLFVAGVIPSEFHAIRNDNKFGKRTHRKGQQSSRIWGKTQKLWVIWSRRDSDVINCRRMNSSISWNRNEVIHVKNIRTEFFLCFVLFALTSSAVCRWAHSFLWPIELWIFIFRIERAKFESPLFENWLITIWTQSETSQFSYFSGRVRWAT